PSDKPEFFYKENALKLYSELAAKYPKSRMASAALSQAGTLYTLFGKAQEAEQAFKTLKTQYPESQEAKDVDFQLGMSLLELNRRAEAVKVFTQMFAGGGKYSDSQIMAAGIQLFDAEQYEIAIQAFDRVLAGAAPTDRAKVEPSLAYRGRALVAMGRHADGVAALQELFKRYPKTAYTVDSKAALSRAFAELGATETDLAKRTKLFNDSVEAMKEVIKYDNTPERRAASTVEVGNIYELRAKAEAQNSLPERATKYRNDAIATYQSLILFPSDQKARPYLETAYYRCLQLFLESENWQDLENDATSYLRIFPSGKHVLEVRQWRSRAKARLAVTGAVTTEGAAAEPVTNPAPAVTPAVTTSNTAPPAVPEASPVTNAP
ncbi:MAG: tetratricopeptide repeat protein, partial [Rubrivivax sp.]